MGSLEYLRKIDALVAEHITKGNKFQGHFVDVVDGETNKVKIGMRWEYPRYSEDIAAAWEVVEKMRENEVLLWTQLSPGGNYRIEIRRFLKSDVTDSIWEKAQGYEVADTAPLAICLAALRAKGVELPEENA